MKIGAMPADPCGHPSHCPPGIYKPIIETLCGTLCSEEGERDVEISSEMRRLLRLGGVRETMTQLRILVLHFAERSRFKSSSETRSMSVLCW